MADFVFSTTDKDARTPVTCEIVGSIPDWLQGSLYRVGSAQFHHGDSWCKHWFDGIAFLHKYAIKDGAVTYQNRKLEGEYYKHNEAARRLVVGGFGHVAHPDPCKSLFDRYFSYFFGKDVDYDNDNVNVILTGDQLYAITESNGMSYIDKDTLDKKGRVIDCDGKLIAVNRHTAHPHYEPDGSIINLGTYYSGRSMYAVIKMPPKEKGTVDMLQAENIKLVASIPARWPTSPCYFHSFGMTENYYVLIEHPVSSNVFSLLAMNVTRSSFKDILKFHPDEKSWFRIVDKKTGKEVANKYMGPACFVFHHINAYEEENNIVMDVCAYPDTTIINELMLESLTSPDFTKVTGSEVWRFVLPLHVNEDVKIGDSCLPEGKNKASAVFQGTKGGVKEILCTPHKTGAFMELPRINYAYNGQKYRYCYGDPVFYGEEALLKKVDMVTGETVTWRDPNYLLAGEPVFVAKSEPQAEDDGVVLAPLIAHREGQKSGLVVLDAKTFTELGRANSPADIKVPMTFHGEFDKIN